MARNQGDVKLAHKISKEEAMEKYERKQRLDAMIKRGEKPSKSTRRHKKYLKQVKKQKGYLAYLKERGGFKTEKPKDEGIGGLKL